MQIRNTSLIFDSSHVKEDTHLEIILQEHFTLKGIIIGCMYVFIYAHISHKPGVSLVTLIEYQQ